MHLKNSDESYGAADVEALAVTVEAVDVVETELAGAAPSEAAVCGTAPETEELWADIPP